MALIKIGLLSTLVTLVSSDYHHFDSYGSYSYHKPWYLHDLYHPESSELVPQFVHTPYYAASSPSFKRVPHEDKRAKKYYPKPELKEVFKSGSTTRCQEVSAKESTADPSVDPHKQRVKCYRCKDPINGSTFEQCSYSTHNPEDSQSSASNPAKKTRKNYRFGDDYFHQAEESKQEADGCERIVRDSMVCMVCRDPKTNGKYEQCSYVAQPNEKAYGYSKSSSFGNNKQKPKVPEQTAPKAKKVKAPPPPPPEESPEDEEAEELEEAEPDSHQYNYEEPEEYHDESSGSGEDKEGHYTYHYPSFHDTYSSGGSENYDDDSKQDSKSAEGSCKTVHKDGQSCKVCTNPKTGGESERCDYAHEPKDKVYKYSKSKSFGYPESSGGDDSGGDGSASSASASSSAQDEDYEPTNVEVAKQKGCRKEKRDSMVCTICKDPKTGEDSEQCNYSYDPEDKVFAYTKSKSFGSPYKSAYSEEERPEESTSYGTSVVYPTGTSPLDYIPKTSESRVHLARQQQQQQQPPKEKKALGKKVDAGFDDAKVRRDEIEKIAQQDAEDRSKCKKVRRGDMTCYRCVDGKGSTNEECVFVADPEPDQPPSPVPAATTTSERPRFRRSAEDDDAVDEEETNEAEPYEYVAETRPVYDKVLGLTLPAYMLTKSPHEIEFDEFVKNSRNS